MKRILSLMAMLLVAGVMVSYGQSSLDLTGHDFRTDSYNPTNGGTEERCIVCHAPHANKHGEDTLLWNQTLTTQTFTMYSNASGSLDNTIDVEPSFSSKLCLSCHDDVTSIGTGANLSTEHATTTAAVGTDLSNDHPISILYNDTDGGLNGTTPNTLPLFSGKVECGSCHDAHDNTNGSFLRMSNAASALCLDCHNK